MSWRYWAVGLYAVFMLLSYLSVAGYGASLLKIDLLPVWLGKTAVYFGLGATILFLARVPMFDPPLMIYIVPFLIGIFLLRVS